jgi:hypothetical protein
MQVGDLSAFGIGQETCWLADSMWLEAPYTAVPDYLHAGPSENRQPDRR